MGPNYTRACELSQHRMLLNPEQCAMCVMHLLTVYPTSCNHQGWQCDVGGEKKGVWQRKCESHLAPHQTAKKDEGRWGTNLKQSKHLRITESTDVTFAHTGVSYAGGFNRAYHNRVSNSDCSDIMTVPAPIGMGSY